MGRHDGLNLFAVILCDADVLINYIIEAGLTAHRPNRIICGCKAAAVVHPRQPSD